MRLVTGFNRAFAVIILFTACNAAKPVVPTTPDAKEWTLNAIPNASDRVGTIFSIDKKGKKTFITTIDLKTNNSTASLTQHYKTKDLSAGIIADFLKLGLGSDTVQRLNHLNASFVVQNAQLTRPDDNLPVAFRQKKQLIMDNIAFLGLEENKVFLITETIKSPNVKIIFDKETSTKINGFIPYKDLLKANPSLSVNGSDSSDLTYNLNEPLILFYKLNKINLSLSNSKGGSTKKTILDAKLNPNPVDIKDLSGN